MGKINIRATGLLALLLMSFSSNKLPKKFNDLLDRAQMTFVAPEGLKSTRIIENRQMNYEYALKYPATDFEVRYAVRPLDNLLKDYAQKEKNKQPGDINIHPNKLHNSLLQAAIMNISGGQQPEIKTFDKNAVKQEFNADWGALAFFETGKEFGQDYKYCLVVAIHKDDVADAYFFYLAKSRDRFDELMQPAFHSLKFK